MALVESLPLAQAPLLARPFYGEGDPGPLVGTLAQVPELLEVTLPFIGAALGPSAVPWRTKEIAILRTSARFGCRFCVETHTPIALDSGLTHDQVRMLREAPNGPVLADAFADESDRALIAWVDALSAGGGPVPASAKAAIAAHYREADIVELTVTVGCTILLNRYATALDMATAPAVRERLAAEGFGA